MVRLRHLALLILFWSLPLHLVIGMRIDVMEVITDDIGAVVADGNQTKKSNLMEAIGTGENQSLQLAAEDMQRLQKKVLITLDWVPPVLDLTNAFEHLWRAIPVSYTREFKITGTLWDMSDELMKRPDLPVSCPSEADGKDVHLVVKKKMPPAIEQYKKAFAGGFCNVAGLFTLAATLASIFADSEVANTVSMVFANPASGLVQDMVDKLFSKIRGKKSSFILGWRQLTGQENSAFLTLADPSRKGYEGSIAKFKCQKVGDGKPFVSLLADAADDAASVPVTARHLALMIIALAE